MMARAAPLLPSADRADRALVLVIAILAALASGAAVTTRGAWSLADEWGAALASSMTVQVRVAADADPDRAAAFAADVLRQTEGVTATIPISRADAEALLAPWLGEAGAPDGAPLPALIDVRLDATAPADRDALAAALDDAGIEAIVDDHRNWSEPLARASLAMRALSGAILAILVVAAVASTVFATLAGLSARTDVVEALYLVGARDEQIAREFTRRFFRLGLVGGAIGAGAAAAAALGLQTVSGAAAAEAQAFLPQVRLTASDVAILACAPALVAAVAAAAARTTVLRALKSRF